MSANAPTTKTETVGVDPKVPIQALVVAIVWVLAHYTGIDLSIYVEVIVSLLAGVVAAILGPAATVRGVVK